MTYKQTSTARSLKEGEVISLLSEPFDGNPPRFSTQYRFESAKNLNKTIFVGETGEKDAVVIRSHSPMGAILQDVDDEALLIDSEGLQTLSVRINPQHSKTLEVSLTLSRYGDGAEDISSPAEQISFDSLRLQTNQSLGFGFTRQEGGITVFVVQKTFDEPPSISTYNMASGVWDELSVDLHGQILQEVQIVTSANPTVASQLLEERWRALTKSQSEIIGSEAVYGIVESISKPKDEPKKFKRLQEAAKQYYIGLTAIKDLDIDHPTSFIAEKSKLLKEALGLDGKSLNPYDLKDELASSKGLFDQDGLQEIMFRLAQVPKDKLPQVEYFLKDLIPTIICLSNTNTTGKYPENNPAGYKAFLYRVLESFETGELEVFSVICPSYNYEVVGAKLDKRANLRHLDGQILPSVGERYQKSVKATALLLSGLAKHLPEGAITYRTYTYSGEKGLPGLWEIGQDVIDYYGALPDGESVICNNLHKMFVELQQQTLIAFSETGIKVEVASLESNIFAGLDVIYNDFMNKFGEIGSGKPTPEKLNEVDEWLQLNLGVGMKWLDYFYNEERAYAQKQGVDHVYNVLGNTLKEALSYWAFQMLAVSKKSAVIWGLETTSNYMVGSLPQFQKSNSAVPCIMARPFNPADPNGFGIRQPFNTPLYNIG